MKYQAGDRVITESSRRKGTVIKYVRVDKKPLNSSLVRIKLDDGGYAEIFERVLEPLGPQKQFNSSKGSYNNASGTIRKATVADCVQPSKDGFVGPNSNKCKCDFNSVIMIHGCQCGGV